MSLLKDEIYWITSTEMLKFLLILLPLWSKSLSWTSEIKSCSGRLGVFLRFVRVQFLPTTLWLVGCNWEKLFGETPIVRSSERWKQNVSYKKEGYSFHNVDCEIDRNRLVYHQERDNPNTAPIYEEPEISS